MALQEAFHYTWEFVSSWIIMSCQTHMVTFGWKKFILKKEKKNGQNKKLFCSYIWANQGCDKGNCIGVYVYCETFHQEVNLPSCVAMVTRERSRSLGPRTLRTRWESERTWSQSWRRLFWVQAMHAPRWWCVDDRTRTPDCQVKVCVHLVCFACDAFCRFNDCISFLMIG